MWEGRDDQPQRCVELGLPRAMPAAHRNLLQPQHPARPLLTPTSNPKTTHSHQLSLWQASTLREDSEGGERFGRNGRKGKTALLVLGLGAALRDAEDALFPHTAGRTALCLQREG